MKIIHFRRAIQVLVLSSIIGCAVLYPMIAKSVLPWLSRFSPLMTITTRLAERQWTPYFFGGVLVAFICLLYPRVFCGWICPLGTCIDITDRITFAYKRRFIPAAGWPLALGIALCLIALAIAGRNTAGYLDPLTLFAHTLSKYTHLSFSDQVDLSFEWYGMKLETVLSLIVGVILAMTVLGRRVWCRLFCPLGGILGILGLLGLFRRTVTSDCIMCGKCQKECKMQAIPKSIKTTTNSMCITCRTCDAACPAEAIKFDK